MSYPFAVVSVIFLFFLHNFVSAKLATSSIGVNYIVYISLCYSCRHIKYLSLSLGHVGATCPLYTSDFR